MYTCRGLSNPRYFFIPREHHALHCASLLFGAALPNTIMEASCVVQEVGDASDIVRLFLLDCVPNSAVDPVVTVCFGICSGKYAMSVPRRKTFCSRRLWSMEWSGDVLRPFFSRCTHTATMSHAALLVTLQPEVTLMSCRRAILKHVSESKLPGLYLECVTKASLPLKVGLYACFVDQKYPDKSVTYGEDLSP